MRAAMQVPQSVEPFQGEAQAGQQPDQEQAALVVMADMLKSIAILGIVAALIFDLPAARGHRVEAAAAPAPRGENGWPKRLHRFPLAMGLARNGHPPGLPRQ